MGAAGGGEPQVALLAGLGPVGQRVGPALPAPGQVQDPVAAGVLPAPIEDAAPGGDEGAVLGRRPRLAEVAGLDGHDREAERADRGGECRVIEGGRAGTEEHAGQSVGGQLGNVHGRVAGAELDLDPRLVPPLPRRPAVKARAGNGDDAGRHEASGTGRSRARAMIVRWISEVPS